MSVWQPPSKEMQRFLDFVGGACRRFRMQKGLTQAAVAMELGVHPKTYERLENAQAGGRLVRYPVLARALGARVMDLLPAEFSKGYAPRARRHSVAPSAEDIARFASRVCRRTRIARGLTLEAVANRVGIERQALSVVELHEGGLTPYRYPVLARALGIRVCDLLPPGFLG